MLIVTDISAFLRRYLLCYHHRSSLRRFAPPVGVSRLSNHRSSLRRFAPPVGVPRLRNHRSSLRRFAPPVGVPRLNHCSSLRRFAPWSEFRDLILIEACQPTLEALAIEPAAAHAAVRRDADRLEGGCHRAIVVDVDLAIAISDLWH